METMEWGDRTPLKRPLSFSEDSYEWDSIRDDVPSDMGWNSMKCEDNGEFILSASDFAIEWVPNGYVAGSRRSAKRRKVEANAATPVQKPKSEATIEFLEEGDREVAAEVIKLISNSAGSFEFENADEEAYVRLLPFPAGVSDDRMNAHDEWHLDQNECKLASLLSGSCPEKRRDISLPPWGSSQRRPRKYEVLNVRRDVDMEDVSVEDGEFSWTTFANLVKPQFTAMEPDARYAAAKRIAEMLNETPPTATAE